MARSGGIAPGCQFPVRPPERSAVSGAVSGALGLSASRSGISRGVSRRGFVGSVPPAVRLRPLDFGQPRRSHPSLLDERRDPVPVALRPVAPRAPGREALEVVVVVEPPGLAVDPPVAECNLDGLGVGDRPLARCLLGELEPDALRLGVVSVQPSLPGLLAREDLDRQVVASVTTRTRSSGRVSGTSWRRPATRPYIRRRTCGRGETWSVPKRSLVEASSSLSSSSVS